jgi:uncharacterized C2H2 Zn-finger protein
MTERLFETYQDELACPRCGSVELNETTGLLNIRAFKVVTKDGVHLSQCLVCKENGDENQGWFCTEIL